MILVCLRLVIKLLVVFVLGSKVVFGGFIICGFFEVYRFKSMSFMYVSIFLNGFLKENGYIGFGDYIFLLDLIIFL